jgi:hypothetical protein
MGRGRAAGGAVRGTMGLQPAAASCVAVLLVVSAVLEKKKRRRKEKGEEKENEGEKEKKYGNFMKLVKKYFCTKKVIDLIIIK